MESPLPTRALALSRLDDTSDLSGFNRLYFGAEFCSWALPSNREILNARKLAHNSGLSFTLMTPVLREETLGELALLFGLLADDWQSEDELLISDLGTLELARQHLPQVPLILGRALSGQKRGPRIEGLTLTDEALEYFKQGSWYGHEARQLLAENGIHRVELDNLIQGISPLPEGIIGSLHHPWLMVTSSRNCPYHQDKSAQRCTVGCGEVFRLSTPQHLLPLFQAGNSQFVENPELPEDIASLGIDRLVEHHQLPR